MSIFFRYIIVALRCKPGAFLRENVNFSYRPNLCCEKANALERTTRSQHSAGRGPGTRRPHKSGVAAVYFPTRRSADSPSQNQPPSFLFFCRLVKQLHRARPVKWCKRVLVEPDASATQYETGHHLGRRVCNIARDCDCSASVWRRYCSGIRFLLSNLLVVFPRYPYVPSQLPLQTRPFKRRVTCIFVRRGVLDYTVRLYVTGVLIRVANAFGSHTLILAGCGNCLLAEW